MNLQSWAILDVDDVRTYLDSHSHSLELERVSTSVLAPLLRVIRKTYDRTKLTIDFFSIVPFSTGTASSGLSALGCSAETWVQICALSQYRSKGSTIRVRTSCAMFRQRTQTVPHSLRPSLYLQSNAAISEYQGDTMFLDLLTARMQKTS